MDHEVTIGIVDNDRFVLPSLKTSITELLPDAKVIWTTADGGEAVQYCLRAATRPKVLLVDMSMERVSGISVCRRIRARISKVGILAMTAYSLDKYTEKASLAGAQGIVGKADEQQIVTALRTVASGGTWGDGFESPLTAHVRLKNQSGMSAVLTDREFEIMDSFAAGMSIKAISETLNITPETVKKHGQRAMHKLGATSRWQAVAMWLNAEA
ncbi:DNA-binding response regulator [Bifidobacterium lemurum]|uniref:DNA-binding response regulator n=1 Tax=Bifidobacterium lemurum TaxID=1603886 RepID=A0A261FT32_9BIFI|nr:response regulator transcription factor [Bifidobacterium lemurum]OZG62354.1 DNA-binding response regulator [Bifidobacterium lemurum]QOL33714.1 response regulator transcription factor [Bifidobacterium lemurum]